MLNTENLLTIHTRLSEELTLKSEKDLGKS